MSGNVGDLSSVVWPSSNGETIDGAIHWVTLSGALNDVQFSIGELDIVGYGDGK